MQAGKLRSRVSIERRSAGQDALGQPITGWETVATTWADIRHQSGMEAVKAGTETSIIKASIRIRYRAGLDAGMRVVHGAEIYDIQAVLPDSRRRFIDLVCEVVQ